MLFKVIVMFVLGIFLTWIGERRNLDGFIVIGMTMAVLSIIVFVIKFFVIL